MTMMTQAQYSRRLHVSAAAVSQWKNRGWLVLQGGLVDVERTDALLRDCRRFGLPAIQDSDPGVKQDHPVVTGTVNLTALLNAARHTRPTSLTAAEIERRLRELDWRQNFAWTDDAQRQRARLGAMCAGFEAVESDLSDDAHWNNFQLRDPRLIIGNEMTVDVVMVGYGYEATAAEVLAVCRAEIGLSDDDDPSDADISYDIVLPLLPLLAYPHYEGQKAP